MSTRATSLGWDMDKLTCQWFYITHAPTLSHSTLTQIFHGKFYITTL